MKPYPYESPCDLANAIFDNEGGTLRQMLEDDPEPLITAALSATDDADIGLAINKLFRQLATSRAVELWNMDNSDYRATDAERAYNAAANDADAKRKEAA